MAERKISEKDFERIMKALANRRRLAILCFLKKASEASWLGSMKNRGELEGEILSPAGSPEDWEGLN